jgi:DNA transposition AAA+ family ATPase
MSRASDNTFIFTPTAQKIIEMIKAARDRNSVALFTGKAGVGKTTIIKYFTDHDRDAIHLTLSPAKRGLLPIMKEIALALGVYLERGNATYIDKQIEHCIKWENTSRDERTYKGKYIIFDEIQNANLNALRQILSYNDAFKFPIIMFGNEHTLKVTRASEAIFDQIDDRIQYRDRVVQTRADIAAICNGWGIRDPDAVAWVIALAGFTTLRQVSDLLQHTIAYAGENAVRVDHLAETLLAMKGNQAHEIMSKIKPAASKAA